MYFKNVLPLVYFYFVLTFGEECVTLLFVFILSLHLGKDELIISLFLFVWLTHLFTKNKMWFPLLFTHILYSSVLCMPKFNND